MRLHYYGEQPGDKPIWERRNLTNPFRGEDGPEHHKRAIESVQRRFMQDVEDRLGHDVTVDKNTVGLIRKAVTGAMHREPGRTIAGVEEDLRARHSIAGDLFRTTLIMEAQVAVLDGFETPGFQAHRQIMVEGEPYMNASEIKHQRITRPPDLEQMETPRAAVPPAELIEQDGPVVGKPLWFRQNFGFDWETTTFAELQRTYEAMFRAGEAANRTLEKFVFNDNLATGANGPSLQIDGSSVNLFADHSSIRGVDNSVDTGGDPTTTNLDSVLDVISGATLDGEPLAKSYGFLVAKVAGSAFRTALRTLDVDADKEPETANNAINLYGTGKAFPYTILGVDLDEWNGTEWYVTFDFNRSPSLGFIMHWLQGMNTPQIVDLDGPSGSRHSRRTMSREFMIQLVGNGTWGDVAGIYRGAT